MKSGTTKENTSRGAQPHTKRVEREVEVGAAGAIAGAAIGAIAGPPGAIAGAVVGALAGAAAGRAAEEADESREETDEELDRETGVSGGELGATNLKHPPAKIGAYSAGSTGVESAADDEEPAEGPIEPPRG